MLESHLQRSDQLGLLRRLRTGLALYLHCLFLQKHHLNALWRGRRHLSWRGRARALQPSARAGTRLSGRCLQGRRRRSGRVARGGGGTRPAARGGGERLQVRLGDVAAAGGRGVCQVGPQQGPSPQPAPVLAAQPPQPLRLDGIERGGGLGGLEEDAGRCSRGGGQAGGGARRARGGQTHGIAPQALVDVLHGGQPRSTVSASLHTFQLDIRLGVQLSVCVDQSCLCRAADVAASSAFKASGSQREASALGL
mmetsp:Transcript_5022/g.9445  ORF Transcript_5022/g.9445 Transcript_5022/m.9445 type:complete len:252 (-) Transcript_5022:1222-1977(-)